MCLLRCERKQNKSQGYWVSKEREPGGDCLKCTKYSECTRGVYWMGWDSQRAARQDLDLSDLVHPVLFLSYSFSLLVANMPVLVLFMFLCSFVRQQRQ